jgi:hypothetical protein
MKYCQITISMFLIVSWLIPQAVLAYGGSVYAPKKARAALQETVGGRCTNESIDKVLDELAEKANVNIFVSTQVTVEI